jgi:hypothetical protein
VRVDFENTDRPAPRNPRDTGCDLRDDVSVLEAFQPPLVRAVRRSHVEIVKMLLAHGGVGIEENGVRAIVI